jgi:prepilin-type N-terminal cleavage/methylation domain-containing protein
VTTQRAATLRRRLNRQQQGFTLLEVLISMFVLTVGLVSMLGVFATAMAATQTAQQDMIAKQLAQQAMETIYTARETANITWDQVQNVGGAGSPGIFRTGLQPIKQVGTDGIMDTINDGASQPQTMTLPGPDGIVQTPTGATVPSGDDVMMGLTNYQRSIAIANTPSADLRSITITVRYTTPRSRFPKTYVLSGFISQYR